MTIKMTMKKDMPVIQHFFIIVFFVFVCYFIIIIIIVIIIINIIINIIIIIIYLFIYLFIYFVWGFLGPTAKISNNKCLNRAFIAKNKKSGWIKTTGIFTSGLISKQSAHI